MNMWVNLIFLERHFSSNGSILYLDFFRTDILKDRKRKHAFHWHGHFGGVNYLNFLKLKIGRQLAGLREKNKNFLAVSVQREDTDNIHDFANSYIFLRSFAKYQVSSHRCLEDQAFIGQICKRSKHQSDMSRDL